MSPHCPYIFLIATLAVLSGCTKQFTGDFERIHQSPSSILQDKTLQPWEKANMMPQSKMIESDTVRLHFLKDKVTFFDFDGSAFDAPFTLKNQTLTIDIRKNGQKQIEHMTILPDGTLTGSLGSFRPSQSLRPTSP
jgi:hypothetical protein